jgi:hypothetical protein
MLEAGYWILEAGCWKLEAGYWKLDGSLPPPQPDRLKAPFP